MLIGSQPPRVSKDFLVLDLVNTNLVGLVENILLGSISSVKNKLFSYESPKFSIDFIKSHGSNSANNLPQFDEDKQVCKMKKITPNLQFLIDCMSKNYF